MNSEQFRLSIPGEARKEAILREALGAARKRRSVRRLQITSAGALFLAIIALFAWRQLPKTASSIAQHTGPITQHSPLPVANARKTVIVTLIAADDRTFERYSRSPAKNYVKLVNDHEFLTAMREAGHPVGLAYVNGEAKVLPY